MSNMIKTYSNAARSFIPHFRASPWHLLSYTILLALTVAYLGPLLMMVNTSLMTSREFMRDATSMPKNLQFENFSEAWEKANFSQYLKNSFIYAGSATAIYVITAVFVAFPISRRYIR